MIAASNLQTPTWLLHNVQHVYSVEVCNDPLGHVIGDLKSFCFRCFIVKCYLIFRKNSTKPVHDICSSRAKPSALGKKSGELIRGDIGVNYDNKYS